MVTMAMTNFTVLPLFTIRYLPPLENAVILAASHLMVTEVFTEQVRCASVLTSTYKGLTASITGVAVCGRDRAGDREGRGGEGRGGRERGGEGREGEGRGGEGRVVQNEGEPECLR